MRQTSITRLLISSLLFVTAVAGCRQRMAEQPRYDPLEASEFYADGQSARPLVENTIARGQLRDDEHFYTVARYVERNALRSGLVERAEQWGWSSLWRRLSGDDKSRALLARWPVPYPRAWLDLVNQPQTDAELEAVRTAVRRGSPLGSERWQQRVAVRLGLESTLRPRGRPRKLK